MENHHIFMGKSSINGIFPITRLLFWRAQNKPIWIFMMYFRADLERSCFWMFLVAANIEEPGIEFHIPSQYLREALIVLEIHLLTNYLAGSESMSIWRSVN